MYFTWQPYLWPLLVFTPSLFSKGNSSPGCYHYSSVWLAFEISINANVRFLFFCDWLFFFLSSTLFVGFVHVAVFRDSLYVFIALEYSTVWVWHHLYTHFTLDRDLVCLGLLRILCCDYSCSCLSVQLPDQMVFFFFFSKVLFLIFFLIFNFSNGILMFSFGGCCHSAYTNLNSHQHFMFLLLHSLSNTWYC